MEDEGRNPLVVLMHGDLKVSTKELARVIGVKTITPCNPDTANKHSGYVVGGTSPFGTRRKMPTYMEETVLELPKTTSTAASGGIWSEWILRRLCGYWRRGWSRWGYAKRKRCAVCCVLSAERQTMNHLPARIPLAAHQGKSRKIAMAFSGSTQPNVMGKVRNTRQGAAPTTHA